MFEKLLESNLINFIIMFWLLSVIFKKAKLGSLIENLAADIRRKIEESKKNAENALGEYEKTKASVEDVHKNQQKIIEEAKHTALALEKNIEHETHVCITELEESFKALAESYGIKAKKQTLAEVYGACIELAGDEVEKNLDEPSHKHLINKGIDDITKMDGICL